MDKCSSTTRQDTLTEASKFFIEFRAGDGTPTVRARFERWLRSSPENVQAYLQIAAGWSDLPTGDPEDQMGLQALLARAKDAQPNNVVHLALRNANRVRHTFQSPKKVLTLVASLAVLIILAGTGTWVAIQRGHTYSTGIGEQRTLILADGSTVTLNALTTIKIHLTRKSREIALVRGQAYFHDTEEPARPFIVLVGQSAVRAIGTEFDVDKESDRTVITVLEGQVAVARSSAWIDSTERRDLLRELAGPPNRRKAVLVSAGKQVTILEQNIPAPSPVDTTTVTAWMQRRLVFDNTPLERVAQQFNLYSKRRLVIADPSLRTVGVSGDYSASAPDALIGFLRVQPTFQVIETDDYIIVKKK